MSINEIVSNITTNYDINNPYLSNLISTTLIDELNVEVDKKHKVIRDNIYSDLNRIKPLVLNGGNSVENSLRYMLDSVLLDKMRERTDLKHKNNNKTIIIVVQMVLLLITNVINYFMNKYV